MKEGGIYLHIPFCLRKCTYCDFYSLPQSKWQRGEYVDGLLQEIKAKAARYPFRAKTLYIGGGTPTVLEAGALGQLITSVREHFSLAPHAEVTIEANPGAINLQQMLALKQFGVNRVSLGVQAMQDHLLRQLGRVHNKDEALHCLQELRLAGIENINADLMCGLPNQTLADLTESIQAMVAAGVTHISLYPLQLEEGTPLYQQVKHGKVQVPADELTLAMLYQAEEQLSKAGFSHYEIANYARSGYQSQHNLIYWHNEAYLGLGPGAASYYQQRRWKNVPDLRAYLAAADNPPMEVDEESQNEAIAMAETVFLGLRLLQEGITRQRFYQRFGKTLDEVYSKQLAELCSQGLIIDDGDRIRLTATGLPIANQVFMAFL